MSKSSQLRQLAQAVGRRIRPINTILRDRDPLSTERRSFPSASPPFSSERPPVLENRARNLLALSESLWFAGILKTNKAQRGGAERAIVEKNPANHRDSERVNLFITAFCRFSDEKTKKTHQWVKRYAGLAVALLGFDWLISNVELSADFKVRANRFMESAKTSSLGSLIPTSEVEKELALKEGVLFEANSYFLFRGEYFCSEDRAEQEKQIERLLTHGRHTPVFKLRPGGTGQLFNPPATVGDVVIYGANPDRPDGWTDNLISFTVDHAHAKSYTMSDGYVIVCVPPSVVCLADHLSWIDRNGEYEYAATHLALESIAMLLVYRKGHLCEVKVNPSFLPKGDVKGDIAFQALMDEVLTSDVFLAQQPSLNKDRLMAFRTLADNTIDLKADFEARLVPSIYEHYARVIQRLVKIHQQPGSFSAPLLRYPGFFHSNYHAYARVAQIVPPLEAILATRSLPAERDEKKLVELKQTLLNMGCPENIVKILLSPEDPLTHSSIESDVVNTLFDITPVRGNNAR